MLLETVGNRIKATWPRYPRATHEEIIRRLKTLGAEFDKEASCWWIHSLKADRALDLFPKAEFDYDVICAATLAATERNEAFYRFLVSAGVKLIFDESGAVCAVGECVSPLLQDEVRKRSSVLRAFVGSQVVISPVEKTQSSVEVEVTDEDRRYTPVLTGIRNAWQAEQERLERGTQRRRKVDYEQGRLIR